MPLAILFGIFAVVGLLIMLAGLAAKSNSPAPSMYRDDVTPAGCAIFIVCILIALAAWASST